MAIKKIGISVSETKCLNIFVNSSLQGRVVCMNSLFSLVHGHLMLIFLGTVFIFLFAVCQSNVAFFMYLA